MKNLNELAKTAHATAVKQGFYEVEPTKEQCILLIGSEVYEAMEADRKGKYMLPLLTMSDFDNIRKIKFKELFEYHIKDTFEDELADVVIRLLDFAGFTKYEIGENTFMLVGDSLKCKFTFLLTLSKIINFISARARDNSINEAIHYIFKYCKLNNINIEKHIELKMKYNLMREYKNGKRY